MNNASTAAELPMLFTGFEWCIRPLPWQQAAASMWWARQQGARAAHASLWVGAAHTGVEQLLHALAAALLCESPSAPASGLACGVCDSCALLRAHSHPDLKVIRPSIDNAAHPIEELRPEKTSKEIGIDDVRALTQMVHQSSHRGGLRVVLVYPVSQLNRHAANALLKTLEEPPERTVFLLAAEDVQAVLPTILSRCQRATAPVPDAAQAVAFLHSQNPDATHDWAAWYAQEHGALLRIVQWVETDYFKLQAQWIEQLAQGARIDVTIVAAAFEKHIKEAEKARQAGQVRTLDMAQLLEWWQRWLHDVLLCAQTAAQPTAPRFYPQYHTQLQQQTAHWDTIRLQNIHQWRHNLTHASRLAEHPLNIRAWLESLLVQYRSLWL